MSTSFIYSFFYPVQSYLSIVGHFEWAMILSFLGCSNRAAGVKEVDCASVIFYPSESKQFSSTVVPLPPNCTICRGGLLPASSL